MITIEDIKNGYIMPQLSKIEGYNFHIVTDTGEWRSPERNGNTVTEYVNGDLSLQGVDFQRLSGGRIASGFEFRLRFLIPLDDYVSFTDGEYPSKEYATVIQFRKALSEVLAGAASISITKTEEETEKTYVGGAFFNLPMPGENLIRQKIGKSIEYTCSISVALLEGGVNTTGVSLTIDGENVSFSSIKIARKPTPSADLISNSTNGESSVYAESTQFTIEFSVPAVSDQTYSSAVMSYVLGLTDGNMPHGVILKTPLGEWETEKQMIFAGCEMQGNGVSNILYGVSLVPYTAPEIVEG